MAGVSINKVTNRPPAELAYFVAKVKQLQNWPKYIRLHQDEQQALMNFPLCPVSYSVTDYIP